MRSVVACSVATGALALPERRLRGSCKAAAAAAAAAPRDVRLPQALPAAALAASAASVGRLAQRSLRRRSVCTSTCVCAAAASGSCSLRPEPGSGCVGLPADGLQLSLATFTVGSASSADVRLQAPGVAGAHALFAWRGGRLYVTHLGSADGGSTLFDGAPLMANVAYLVGPGARITLGGTAGGAAGGVAADFTVNFDVPAAAPQSGSVESLLMQAFKQARPSNSLRCITPRRSAPRRHAPRRCGSPPAPLPSY